MWLDPVSIHAGICAVTAFWQDPDAQAGKAMFSGAELRAMTSQGFEVGDYGQLARNYLHRLVLR